MRVLNRDLSPLEVIYAVSILAACIWMLAFGPVFYTDTPSYLNAYTNSLSQCRLDPYRTPLYPLLLGWTREVFGEKVFPWIIMLLQYALFLLSIKYFHLSAQRFLPEQWSLAITAFYAIYPTFSSWSNLLLTESIALALSVFLMHSYFKLVLDKDGKSALLMFLFLFLLLALRPASIALLPALALSFFIMLFFRNKRKSAILGLICIILASGMLFGYSAAIEKRTGVFSPSIVSVYNNYTIAKDYKYLDHEINLPKTDILEVKALVRQSCQQNRKGWVVGTARRFYDATRMPSLTSYTSILFQAHPLYPINIGMILLSLLVYLILSLIATFHGDIPKDYYFLLFTSGSFIILSILGAQYEWNRLSLPAQPMILIILAQLLTRIQIKK